MKIILYLMLTLFSYSTYAISNANITSIINNEYYAYRSIHCKTILDFNNLYAMVCNNVLTHSDKKPYYLQESQLNKDTKFEIQLLEDKSFYMKPYINKNTYGIQLSVPITSLK